MIYMLRLDKITYLKCYTHFLSYNNNFLVLFYFNVFKAIHFYQPDNFTTHSFNILQLLSYYTPLINNLTIKQNLGLQRKI